MIYLSLFTVCFMVATIVPFGSEMYFGTLLSLEKYNNFFLLVAASLGNVLGSVFNWVCGYYVNYFIKKPWLPIKQNRILGSIYRRSFNFCSWNTSIFFYAFYNFSIYWESWSLFGNIFFYIVGN